MIPTSKFSFALNSRDSDHSSFSQTLAGIGGDCFGADKKDGDKKDDKKAADKPKAPENQQAKAATADPN